MPLLLFSLATFLIISPNRQGLTDYSGVCRLCVMSSSAGEIAQELDFTMQGNR
jgi:hypothetical protein